MAKKRPAIMFYPGDWLRDSVAGCSLAAQGLWLRMMILAHDSPHYGCLCRPDGSALPADAIARQCGCSSVREYETLLAELDCAGVPGRSDAGAICSRRMIRDEKQRAASVRNGRKGGNPKLLYEWDVGGVNPPDKSEPVIEDEDPPENFWGRGSPRERVPGKLRTDRFFAAWGQWVAYRREIGKPMTNTMADAQLKQFEGWGEDRAVAAIENTITRGWWGLREPEPSNGSPARLSVSERKRTAIDVALANRGRR